MAGDDSVLHARCGIFVFRIGGDLLQKFRFPAAEVFAADGPAVFIAAVRLVFAAIQHDPPQRTETERVVGNALVAGGVFRQFFGIDPPGVMVPAGEDHGDGSAGDLPGDLMDRAEVFHIAAVFRHVAVQQKQVQLIPEERAGFHGCFDPVVSVRHLIDPYIRTGHRTEGQGEGKDIGEIGEVGFPFVHDPPADGVFLRFVQQFHRHVHLMGHGAGTQDPVGVIIEIFSAHCDPHDTFPADGDKDLVFAVNGIDGGGGRKEFGEVHFCFSCCDWL